MRWLPAIIFSPSSSSNSNSASTKKTFSASSSEPKKSSRSPWYSIGRKSTRSKKLLRHVEDDHCEYEPVAALPFTRSPSAISYIRSSTSSSVAPQPLPLPEISSPALHRNRDADCRLPSPRVLEPEVRVDASLPVGFKMRSVFASTRKNTEQNVETKSGATGNVRQDTSGAATPSNRRGTGRGTSFWIKVPTRSAPSSPFGSPFGSPTRNTKNDDFVPYYYVSPKPNQFWSAPEMPTFTGQQPPTANSQQNPKSPTRPSSPLPARLSLDTPTKARREGIAPLTVHVHPLPLPPWPGTSLPSPTATSYSQPGPSQPVSKTESISMKSQWQKGKLIGRGTFGSVYAATNRETGAMCAMKEADIFFDDPKSAESIKQLEQEIKVLSNLKHPNIVQYYGSEIVEDKFYIYLEYVHPGSINKYVRDHCGAITESVVRNFTRHILSGLAYLHSKHTIHRDIKGANLLVDSAGVVKLADFGMAKHLTGNSADLSLKGSPYWMAPELMQAVMQKDNSSDLAFAIDIWSLGCTIIEMFTGKPPWSEYEGAAAMFKVMKDIPPIPETLSSEGKDFLRLCFKRNPAERPTASMLLEHRFLKNLQQQDVSSSSSHQYNGTNLMDKPHSPKEWSENKLDQISLSSTQILKGKSVAESGMATLPYSLYS